MRMETQHRPKQVTRTWVEWRAGRMDDPVTRLRYLRKAAPPPPVKSGNSFARTAVVLCLLAVVLASGFLLRARVRVEPLPTYQRHVRPPAVSAERAPDVWQVEKNPEWEVYSNGLRIDNRFAISTHPRSYRTFAADGTGPEENQGRTEPAGIVFHTTESQQAPFEAGQNRVLKQVGESILEFVRRHHSYNFLVDRFGRVYRIVRETDVAEHAGHSVWSDEHHLYINLNESFIGVSFEARTEPGQEVPTVSPGQIRAAAMLTEMLRSRYSIPATDCVTHGQVSVNPANMRIGWHTDWASSFPFERLGLPDNYLLPFPAVAAFGFEYDETFVRSVGTRLVASAEAAEARLGEEAAGRAVTLEAYRRTLQRGYRERAGRTAAVVPESAERVEQTGAVAPEGR
jgi:hypothetical protein